MTDAPDPHAPPAYRYRFGSAEFDEARFELRVADLPVEVERRALDVLGYLLRHAGEIVTKEELLREVWAGRVTVDKVLPNAIAKLRRALGEANAERLVTQARVGYRLDGEVARVAVGRRIDSRLDLAPGRPVPGRPNFTLRRQLGANRGSEVWLAEQAKTHVLRVYKFGADGERLRALKREATLARVLRESLDERGRFVDIIDWNFENPPFFLECEYGGDNLLEWSIASLAATGTDERLALFLQVADAVDAAHGVGVLHKDLKPANVLVDERDGALHVRLTDFGSGHLVDPERLAELGITRLGPATARDVATDSTAGTALYVAPELFAGQAPTVRSDVYALGVMLFQLLAGDLARPMASGWERDVDDELLREDIRLATDGEPQRRLASAAELAARLRGLAARRDARSASAQAERRDREAREALARSRARRPYAIALLGALAAGLLAALGLWIAASGARDEAQRELARANAINRFLNEDLIGRSNPLVLSKGGDASLKDVLLGARARIATRFAGQPLTEASIRTSLTMLLNMIERLPEAEDEARRALALYEREEGEASLDALKARTLLARLLTRTGKFDESLEHLNALDRLIGDSQDPQRRFLRASAWGIYAMNRGDYAKALPEYRTAIPLLRATDPDNVTLRDSMRMDLVGALTQTGHLDEARAEGESLIAEARARADDNGLVIAFAQAAVARTYTQGGDPAKAQEQLLEAQKTIVERLGEDHTRNLMVLSDLFDVAMKQRDWPHALDYAQRVHEGFRKRLGAGHNVTAVTLANWGQALYESGDARDAAAKLQPAYDQLAAQLGANNPQCQVAGFWLVAAEIELGRVDEAMHGLDRLDASALEAGAADGLWKARLDALHGLALVARGDQAAARTRLRAALAGFGEAKESLRDRTEHALATIGT
ncbi:protein kinase domain-containing protein [Dokdonella fugitiva]|jgi:non-specific serine/threonine protein kinase|uniref:Non-specific serine/threonine protein kinase n=1 Tax=Dokdonella fugitiva TaxID=328517 RepID=A0A4R2IKP0_9GAMM|nr:winged helix-turn-helix domain-containing protein [Dokdonella fugitiva]MBA8882749.1 non-specific serine/threonine protein kinase [Dokdonella fugitiva]TCO43275.1 non-specific serine/threonine protein kinase [Dokdonella fugitiva]